MEQKLSQNYPETMVCMEGVRGWAGGRLVTECETSLEKSRKLHSPIVSLIWIYKPLSLFCVITEKMSYYQDGGSCKV